MPNVVTYRQTYNVLGAFVSPSPATGYMFSLGTAANPTSGTNLLKTIPRVQSASVSLSVPKEDVNQYGMLDRLDALIVSPPEVTMNLDYLPLDGYVENLLGFAASGQQSFISGFLDGTQSEKNYFLGVAPEGVDLINASSITSANNINVIGIGNGVITNYGLNLSVGQIPRASVSIAANNQQTYIGSTGKQSPAIDPNTALQVSGPLFTLPTMQAYTGTNVQAALRPGDIVLNLPRTGSMGDYTSGIGQIWVQSVSLNVPIAIDPIQQLGNPFPVARKIRFPVNSTLSIDALAGDVAEGNLVNLMCSDAPVDLSFSLRNPACNRQGSNALTVWFNQAEFVGREYQGGIGQNSTVRLTYVNQLQGLSSSYLNRGIVMSGSYGQTNPL